MSLNGCVYVAHSAAATTTLFTTLGVMDVGTAMAGLPLPMETVTKVNTSMINVMARVCTNIVMAESTMDNSVMTSAMDTVYFPGRMVPCTMVNFMKGNAKDKVPTHVPLENTKENGKMDGIRELELLHGKMGDGIVGNG